MMFESGNSPLTCLDVEVQTPEGHNRLTPNIQLRSIRRALLQVAIAYFE